MAGQNEKKSITKSKIVNYIINNKIASKAELAQNLSLSMPTVLSNVNELIERNMVIEIGEYESTGGRKAKRIGINPAYKYAVGAVITANHLEIVLLNMQYEIEKTVRMRLKFSTETSYCLEVAEQVENFLKDVEDREQILGIGISIPGIIDQENRLVMKSHTLQVDNFSLSFLEQAFSYPVYFANDANAAMLAEDLHEYQDAVYLSLNNTLGGAFSINGKLVTGQNQKAGEFGHIILVPGGKKCYCGKAGCADAYCAASALTLEQFMKKVEQKNTKAVEKWNQYLDNLAILISNLRMAYDTDIILGGEVGGYLSEYMIPLGEKVMAYNGFEHDVRYLKNCSYKREASAVGAAKYFLSEYIQHL